ncbi:hypothetical protein ABIF38_000072 [Bradyrhizobium japonicum]|uniref:Uncharacterized protein n=1 Tax=Bradyrhizobium ottawaense TaxID=931866 RepID=A0ABV4FIX1_9BRAD|nr:hypothetical protein [Bradyrhizobium elkanii]MCP1737469.1 hypothetical protein [Bradyrhizobium elkanii]MCS3576026.1 hypothetical protein [Bradyrhizobium elkanii]MCS3594637.1 hypothetical protein [Bradyrhizobium elkanii]MCS3625831.1 hypothetical protein [Bradyrhizobium elkanii]
MLHRTKFGQPTNADLIPPFKTRIVIDRVRPHQASDFRILPSKRLSFNNVTYWKSWRRFVASEAVGKLRQSAALSVVPFKPLAVFGEDVGISRVGCNIEPTCVH